MNSLGSLTVLLLVAGHAFATLTVPLKRVVNTNPVSASERALAREAYLEYDDPNDDTIPIVNEIVLYIGDPPTDYVLQFDTGSSNLFCGIVKNYVRTATSIYTGEKMNITFGSGKVNGEEYLDQVTIGQSLTIVNQSIGDVTNSTGFEGLGIDGIAGFGPTNLTLHTLSPNQTLIPTLMDNLVAQGLIEEKVFSIFLAPSTVDVNTTNGALTLGGIDESLFEGELTYVPLTNTSPASHYWGIDVALITYGNQTIAPNSSAGIVDSGTTLVLLSEESFNTYMGEITGAFFDNQTGLIEIPKESVSLMKPLGFMISDRMFELDVEAQLVPKTLNVFLGGDVDKQYGVVGQVTTAPGAPAFGFVLGMFFMERYYTVFDAAENQIGFAKTNYTYSQSS